MKGISFTHRGDFSKTEKFFNKVLGRDYLKVLERYGQEGVRALSSATPRDTGNTAAQWDYVIQHDGNGASLGFINTNENKGVNVAVILQYGHGTRNGGYVAGRDYINPAVRPVFDKIADEAWKEIQSL